MAFTQRACLFAPLWLMRGLGDGLCPSGVFGGTSLSRAPAGAVSVDVAL